MVLLYLLNCLQKDASSSLAATKEMTSLLDKERKDWNIRQAEMVKQIADLQEECRSVLYSEAQHWVPYFTVALRKHSCWISTYIIHCFVVLVLGHISHYRSSVYRSGWGSIVQRRLLIFSLY